MNVLKEDFYIICNCGKEMKDMGEWPVEYPRSEGRMNTQRARRFTCETCRVPIPEFQHGIPVCIAILKVGSDD